MDHNPQTHIYRIEHPETGQLKVVHRNLLLCVNFLPLEGGGEDDSDALSQLSEADSYLGGQSTDAADPDGVTPDRDPSLAGSCQDARTFPDVLDEDGGSLEMELEGVGQSRS